MLRGMEHLLVGVDGSPDSMAALRWAVAEAPRRAATVVAVLVRAVPEPGCLVDALALPADSGDPWPAAVPAVRREVAKIAGVALEVLDGEPSSVLVARSADAQLLVLGARGGDVPRRLLLGSVAERCSRLARCPTVVVRATVGRR